MPTTTPDSARISTIGISRRASPTASSMSSVGEGRVHEGRHDPRRGDHREHRERAEHGDDDSADRAGDAPGTLALAALVEFGEDRDERGAQRRVGDQRAQQVGDLVGDRERAHGGRHAEDRRSGHLTEQACDARERGRGAEDGCGGADATAFACRLARESSCVARCVVGSVSRPAPRRASIAGQVAESARNDDSDAEPACRPRRSWTSSVEDSCSDVSGGREVLQRHRSWPSQSAACPIRARRS